MRTKFFVSGFLILILACAHKPNKQCEVDTIKSTSDSGLIQQSSEKITLIAADGLEVTADVYFSDNAKGEWIILCHQAGFSRGEYLEIAPKLNKLGYNCIALDQRSGNEVNGIKNETKTKADKLNLATAYADAIPDLKAALDFINNEKKASKVILWGSSYSAALTFVMASEHPEQIDAIVAFSPGEYFKVEGNSIADFAQKVTCPVFVSSAKNEHDAWKDIFENVKTSKTSHLPTTKGIHGSRGLWESTEGFEEAWGSLEVFLKAVSTK